MQLLTYKIPKGHEVMAFLTAEFEKQSLKSGAIVSVIGAVDSCCISNMPASDAMQDILHEYTAPFELSGTGEIRDGKPHIHCTLSREGDTTIHGHLHRAKIETRYVSVFVLVG